MEKLKVLFNNNQAWAEAQLKKDPAFFKRTAQAQAPQYLWIGCSDSRVPANEIVGLEMGELFVHRNIANLFPPIDLNCLSVLEYAIDHLKVKHVIVCGHYGCGGIKAALEEHHLGYVDNWLRNIRDTYAKQELTQIQDLKQRHNRLVELNVYNQVLNICQTTIVQSAWKSGQAVTIHGWVYDMEMGRLKDLDCCVSSIDQM